MEKVKENIQLLEESEAKSLLLMIYARLDMARNGNGEDDFNQTIAYLLDIYARLPDKRI